MAIQSALVLEALRTFRAEKLPPTGMNNHVRFHRTGARKLALAHEALETLCFWRTRMWTNGTAWKTEDMEMLKTRQQQIPTHMHKKRQSITSPTQQQHNYTKLRMKQREHAELSRKIPDGNCSFHRPLTIVRLHVLR